MAAPDLPAVLHVTSARTWRGGEQQALYLAEGLAALGARQSLVCVRGSAVEARCRAAGLDHLAPARRASVDPLFARAVARAAAALGADVIHAHDPHAHAAAVLATALFGARAPIALHRRVDFAIGAGPFTRWKYDHAAVRRILCVSRAVAARLAPRIRAPEERLRVVHSAIDLSRFAAGRDGAFRAELGVAAERPLVGFVGALDALKDPAAFVEIAARVTAAGLDATWVLVGEGPERAALEAGVRARGLDGRVRFSGFRRDVARLLPDLDLLLHPTRAEGLGTTLLDAMACGVPVVATRTGGIPEIVTDGETGLLAEPGDVEALAGAAARVLQDGALRRRLVAGGHGRAAEHGIDALVQRTLAVDRELLATRAG